MHAPFQILIVITLSTRSVFTTFFVVIKCNSSCYTVSSKYLSHKSNYLLNSILNCFNFYIKKLGRLKEV